MQAGWYVIRRITKQKQAKGKQENAAAEKKAKALKKQLHELDRLGQSTYEDKVLGKIPEALCVRLMSGYQTEQAEKEAQLRNWKGGLRNTGKCRWTRT